MTEALKRVVAECVLSEGFDGRPRRMSMLEVDRLVGRLMASAPLVDADSGVVVARVDPALGQQAERLAQIVDALEGLMDQIGELGGSLLEPLQGDVGFAELLRQWAAVFNGAPVVLGDELSVSAHLLMETVVARQVRLGEPFWQFDEACRPAAEELEQRGDITVQPGVAPNSFRVQLTEQGHAMHVFADYVPPVEQLESEVSRIWGAGQFDWTVGRSPEGWFYYCGTMRTPTREADWKHGGSEPTLTAALRKMIALEHEPSNRLSDTAKRIMELEEQAEVPES